MKNEPSSQLFMYTTITARFLRKKKKSNYNTSIIITIQPHHDHLYHHARELNTPFAN